MPLIAFQGRPGAYSDLACRAVRPGWQTLPCYSFAEVIEVVRDGRAQEALLPCENSLAGRVPEIHALLPEAGLKIIGEHFHRVEHCLVGIKGTKCEEIRRVHSHPVALAQVRRLMRENGFEAVSAFDTAGATEMIAQWDRKEDAAIASSLAAELNGLEIIASNVEDAAHNTTRFYHVAVQEVPIRRPVTAPMMTTMMVRVQNIPGALYSVLGCFARYGVNMTRIESYMLHGSFAATQFLMDVEGSPEEQHCAEAFAALEAVSQHIHFLGVYPRSQMHDSVVKCNE